MSALPLAGRRILVTRAAHQAGKLSDGLRELGAAPVEIPVIEIRPPDNLEPLDAALRRLGDYDWLILTSANAVRVVVERGSRLRVDLGRNSLNVAAVGEATAAEASRAGLRIAFVPETYVAECLVAGLGKQISDKKVLLARAAIARDVIPTALREAGATVDVVDAYQNILPETAPAQLREALSGGIDAATFTSSSSVTHLAKAVHAAGVEWPMPGVAAVSIGPVTSNTLRASGWEPAAEADPHDIPGLIAAVERVFQATARG